MCHGLDTKTNGSIYKIMLFRIHKALNCVGSIDIVSSPLSGT